MKTEIHDSQTCDCQMCEWANKQEQEPSQTPDSTLWADAATVRAAIADILDTGYLDADGRERAWLFLLNESDEETNRRGEFLDAVIARIEKLKKEAWYQ